MMEEKMDHPAENELPLFGEESAENRTPSAPEDTPPAVENATDADSVPEVPAAPESAVMDTAAPAAELESSALPEVADTGSGVKIPPGLRPTPAFGNFLRQAREYNRISLDDLARITRIKRGYLEAVEQESYSDLPAVVYALAYINVLADYYGVDDEGKAILTSEVRSHLEYKAPEENKTVVGFEPSEENQILLRRIMFAGAGIVVLLTVLITLAVLFFTSGGTEADGGSGTVAGGEPAGLGESQLVELQPAPALQTHVLPVPKR